MAIVDLVKWDGESNILAYKYPSEELSTWTQLVINQSQEAFLVRGGVYDGPYLAGRHTLSTENIPFLISVIGLPFGRKSPFSAEVWFVNKTFNLNINWGTPDPIQLLDPKYSIWIPVRAYGTYGLQISDTKRFLLKLVGTLPEFTAEQVSGYFRGVLLQNIRSEISRSISETKVSILEISNSLSSISLFVESALNQFCSEYGVHVRQFNIISINVPEDDPSVTQLKNALSNRIEKRLDALASAEAAVHKKNEMDTIGYTYEQEKSFEVLNNAASNEGMAGSVMSAGLGLGVGVGMGGAIGNSISQISGALSPMLKPHNGGEVMNHQEKMQALKDLASLKELGILTEEEFQQEKTKILARSTNYEN